MASKVEQKITSSLLEKIAKAEKLPWQRPWELRDNQNAISKHEYRGVNRLMTSFSDYACPYWISYKKALEKDGQVNKGERGLPIIFLGSSKDKKNDDKSYSFLRYYTVFNLEQTTLPIPELDSSKESYLDIQTILNSSRLPEITFGGSKAFYAPSSDKITIPYLAQYTSKIEFYLTIFHELVHSTGHNTRLRRDAIINPANMQAESYSFEELVAEIGAALLCSKTGNYDKLAESNSIAYIQSWKNRLSNNPDWIIRAASQAEKAVDYILGKDKVTYAK